MSLDPMEIQVVINNELDRRIANAFLPFDANSNKLADIEDCGDILRYLGCVPSQEEIDYIAYSSEFEPNGGEMHLAYFVPLVAGMIMQKRMAPATAEQLLQMFEIMDEDNRRYFTKEELTYFVTEFEEQFTEKEVEEMMNVAVDRVTNTIPYEFYINHLIFEPENSIYQIAEKIEADRIAAMAQTKKVGDILKNL